MSDNKRDPLPTPWMTLAQAAAYVHRGKRFVRREITAGRMRGAVVGGKREILTRADWCDQWVIDQSTPVEVFPRRLRR